MGGGFSLTFVSHCGGLRLAAPYEQDVFRPSSSRVGKLRDTAVAATDDKFPDANVAAYHQRMAEGRGLNVAKNEKKQGLKISAEELVALGEVAAQDEVGDAEMPFALNIGRFDNNNGNKASWENEKGVMETLFNQEGKSPGPVQAGTAVPQTTVVSPVDNGFYDGADDSDDGEFKYGDNKFVSGEGRISRRGQKQRSRPR